jgi:hypothetical protein
MKTVDLIGLMDLHCRKLTCLFPQSEPKIDRSGLLLLSKAFPVHTKRLGRPVVISINGKHDDKHSKPNTTCILSFKKNKKKCANNQSRKPTKKTKLLNRWETDFINQKRTNSMKA